MTGAGGVGTRLGTLAHVLRAVGATLAIPLAMFATTGMSQLPPAVVDRVVVVDGAVYIGFDPSVGAGYWATTSDGWTFAWVTGTDAGLAAASASHRAADPTLPVTACVPSQPEVCFRTVPGRIGVERSGDAGETWQPEWGLTDQQTATIGDTVSFDEDLVSMDLAVVEDGTGFRVYVANGVDGFSERTPDGVWRRVPTHYVSRAERALTRGSAIAAPPVPAAWRMPWVAAIVWAGFAALAVLWALLLPPRDRTGPRSRGRTTALVALSGALWLPSLIASSVPPQPSWDAAALNSDIGYTGMMAVGWAAVATVAGAAIAASLLKAPKRPRDAAFGWGATAGLVAMIAGVFVSSATASGALAGAAAVVAAGGVWPIARWRTERGRATNPRPRDGRVFPDSPV